MSVDNLYTAACDQKKLISPCSRARDYQLTPCRGQCRIAERDGVASEYCQIAEVAGQQPCGLDLLSDPPLIKELTIRRERNEYSIFCGDLLVASGCSKDAILDLVGALLEAMVDGGTQ